MTNNTETDITIFEPAGGGAGRHTYVVTVKQENGEPLGGVDVKIAMKGDGSLAPAMSSAEIYRETDASGRAHFNWYRRSIFTRDVRATLNLSIAEAGVTLSYEETAAEAATTSYQSPGGMTRL